MTDNNIFNLVSTIFAMKCFVTTSCLLERERVRGKGERDTSRFIRKSVQSLLHQSFSII